jgi:ribose transport system ATP-binding protein
MTVITTSQSGAGDPPVPGSGDRFTLRARNLRKSFGGVEVLHGVDLEVQGGQVVALLGENGAGKSTLVRLLAGDHSPDSGEICIGEQSYPGLDPVSARRCGIRMIFQEFTDAPTLSVSENISLGRWARPWHPVRWSEVRKRAESTLEALGASIDPDATVAGLRVGERLRVEIARALGEEARCRGLDEPTAALSSEEVDRLFEFVRRLRSQGVAIVYITHRLAEVIEIADQVVVLRDGEVTMRAPARDLSRREIVTAMVGQDLGEVVPAASTSDALGEVVVRLSNASSVPSFSDVSLEVRAGEVVALYGKVGSGTAEVADAIFGRRGLESGSLEIAGVRARRNSPRRAIRAGIGYLPADRQREGGMMSRTVEENLCAPSWPRLARLAVITSRSERQAFRRWRDELRIRMSGGSRQSMATLSGGNQQKVLLARWFERGSTVLSLVEPTRGVDVGARQDIYRVLRQGAAQGKAVVVATSDTEEVVQLADRAIVFVRGQIKAELSGTDITADRLASAVGG